MRLWILFLVLLASDVICRPSARPRSRPITNTTTTRKASESLAVYRPLDIIGINDPKNLEDGSWVNNSVVDNMIIIFLCLITIIIVFGCVGLVMLRLVYRTRADEQLDTLADKNRMAEKTGKPSPFAVQHGCDANGNPSAPQDQVKEKITWDKHALAGVINRAAALPPPTGKALAANGRVRIVADNPYKA